MKYFFLLSLFSSLPFLGCNNEAPTSPQEPQQNVRAENFPPQQNSEIQPQQQSIIISQPWDWTNNGGKIITQKEAILLTNNYTHSIGRIQKIFVSRTLLESAMDGNDEYGVIFYLGTKRTGEITVVSIPANIYGKRITTSTAIGNEGEFISYARAQQLTHNFSYKIGDINGRMASKEFIRKVMGEKGVYLHCAYNTDKEFTFVIEGNETNNFKLDEMPPPSK
mgnify:CR=1 FL=1